MFLRRSLASLARAYKLHVYDFFFLCRYIWGLAPPPHTKKLATLLLPAFAHQKSGQMKMADSVPPTRYTKSPPLITIISQTCRNFGVMYQYRNMITSHQISNICKS